ncbi:MAG: hypothetical protein LBS06_04665 [Treponema sp.]|nr:hypothetical protein [Treponema sp.]
MLVAIRPLDAKLHAGDAAANKPGAAAFWSGGMDFPILASGARRDV